MTDKQDTKDREFLDALARLLDRYPDKDRLIFGFSGSGDSGDINYCVLWRNDANATEADDLGYPVDPDVPGYASYWGFQAPENSPAIDLYGDGRQQVDEKDGEIVSDYCREHLTGTGDWYNNEGGQGTTVMDLRTGAVYIDVSYNEMISTPDPQSLRLPAVRPPKPAVDLSEETRRRGLLIFEEEVKIDLSRKKKKK